MDGMIGFSMIFHEKKQAIQLLGHARAASNFQSKQSLGLSFEQADPRGPMVGLEHLEPESSGITDHIVWMHGTFYISGFYITDLVLYIFPHLPGEGY